MGKSNLVTDDNGKPKAGPGRPKGSANKTTLVLKEAILLAAENAGNALRPGEGIAGYLEVQASENPGPFMTLMGKILPQEMKAEVSGPNGKDLFTPEQIVRMAAEVQSKGKKE